MLKEGSMGVGYNQALRVDIEEGRLPPSDARNRRGELRGAGRGYAAKGGGVFASKSRQERSIHDLPNLHCAPPRKQLRIGVGAILPAIEGDLLAQERLEHDSLHKYREELIRRRKSRKAFEGWVEKKKVSAKAARATARWPSRNFEQRLPKINIG
jgi:hypothetical protein